MYSLDSSLIDVRTRNYTISTVETNPSEHFCDEWKEPHSRLLKGKEIATGRYVTCRNQADRFLQQTTAGVLNRFACAQHTPW